MKRRHVVTRHAAAAAAQFYAVLLQRVTRAPHATARGR